MKKKIANLFGWLMKYIKKLMSRDVSIKHKGDININFIINVDHKD